MLQKIKLIVLLLGIQAGVSSQIPIDRKALVERHTVRLIQADSLSPLSVGNGNFAFTADVTGLQSFPDFYQNGVPLGTQSEWGWHSFPNDSNYRFEETLEYYDINGRQVSYSVQSKQSARSQAAVDWFRQNPHRLQLGNVGFEFVKKDGSAGSITDITNVRQSLNMWTGELRSRFIFDKEQVDVTTFAHPQQDAISIKINSKLLSQGRLKIRVRFADPTGNWKDGGNEFNLQQHYAATVVSESSDRLVIQRKLDSSAYLLTLDWKGGALIKRPQQNYFVISPRMNSLASSPASASFEMTCRFSRQPVNESGSFQDSRIANSRAWSDFWNSGAAVDFSGSKDKRAFELERRIILSQYLTKIQCAGDYPPQETGLTYNSWYGRPHLEMHWWHGVHFSLWNRNKFLEKTLGWYQAVAEKGRAIAKRQGYDGIRWQKMTDNDGNESPSSVGAFLIWQQPHPIYFAELCYRNDSSVSTLNKYKDLVFATADFMASYVSYDSLKQRYVLGPGVIPAQERFHPLKTYNPAYELVYWQWALETAAEWKTRAGLPAVTLWNEVSRKLSPLTISEDKYLFNESNPDSYTNPEFRTDHPSVLGSLGMLPQSNMVDTNVMRSTFKWIMTNWNWDKTWGWDFPMTAMTATRLGLPEQAIEALMMPVRTNTYLANGHNYQDQRLTIYLPGNGGLLAAIALMCAGYDGCNIKNPGIPKDGRWKVRWEGLKQMP